jgi:Tol biopolymer transport system component
MRTARTMIVAAVVASATATGVPARAATEPVAVVAPPPAALARGPLWAGATTIRVSRSSDGGQADAPVDDLDTPPAITSDGRFVAYRSGSSNVVPGDTNGVSDIFVYDRWTRQNSRISVASDGVQSNNTSGGPAFSPDGRYVTYWSLASNLVGGDTNDAFDIFVHDRWTRRTTRVSMGADGHQTSWSYGSTISRGGRYVAYRSDDNTVVPGDTNGESDLFVFDRWTRRTTQVSVASDGAEANSGSGVPVISADGRYVTFSSTASNLVPADTNHADDVFLHDRWTKRTTRVSVASDGTQGDDTSGSPALSSDGRYVSYASDASNLVPGDKPVPPPGGGSADVFAYDRWTKSTTRISVAPDNATANGGSDHPTISADGRYVAFRSGATNLVAGDTNRQPDDFVADRWTRRTTRVSVASNGAQANGYVYPAAISGDARYVAYGSDASNLVRDDTNGWGDLFLSRRGFAC